MGGDRKRGLCARVRLMRVRVCACAHVGKRCLLARVLFCARGVRRRRRRRRRRRSVCARGQGAHYPSRSGGTRRRAGGADQQAPHRPPRLRRTVRARACACLRAHAGCAWWGRVRFSRGARQTCFARHPCGHAPSTPPPPPPPSVPSSTRSPRVSAKNSQSIKNFSSTKSVQQEWKHFFLKRAGRGPQRLQLTRKRLVLVLTRLTRRMQERASQG